jgi:hypothetical protein
MWSSTLKWSIKKNKLSPHNKVRKTPRIQIPIQRVIKNCMEEHMLASLH